MSDQDWHHWRLERDRQQVAWLHFDMQQRGANVLSRQTLAELDEILERLLADRPRALVIRSDKPGGFIAGADISEFRLLRDSEQAREWISAGHAVIDKLEGMPMRTISLIHGHALGGGLELAMACDHRVATADPATRIGLPEAMLGLHPGFGGTVRTVRLAGAARGLELIASGRSLSARQARRAGLVDLVVPARQLEQSVAYLLTTPRPRPGSQGRRWQHRLLDLAPVRPALAWWIGRQLRKRVKPEHYPAPFAAVDLWRRHGGNEPAMLRAEIDSVARLIVSPTAHNLVRLFFLQERLKAAGKVSGVTLERVHVVGAGVMGGDIAAWCALRGLWVTLQDARPEAVAAAMVRARRLFARKLPSKAQVTAALDRLIPDAAGHGVASADLVIEAIVEDLDAKQALYAQIAPQLKEGALLATNTSSLPLEQLAAGLAYPQRLVGIHFFNPVARMQLVEVVRSQATAADALAVARGFVGRIGRLPLVVGSAPGFLVNRVLTVYMMEALLLLEQGVPEVCIDQAARDFGMPMGPVELADTVGLDVALAVGRTLAEPLGFQIPARLCRLVEAGRLGRKSGQGFYRYARRRWPLVGKERPQKIPPPRGYRPPEDVQLRLVARMLNEAVACLRQGIVEDADMLDAGLVFGAGFAPFRGGPIAYLRSGQLPPGAAPAGDVKADDAGSVWRAQLQALQARHGERFQADPGWDSLTELIANE